VRSLFIFIIAVRFVCSTYAQTNKASLNFQISFPAGDYKKNYPVTSTGLIFGILHQLKTQEHISIGGELGILQVSGDDHYYKGIYNNEYNNFLVSSWNSILTIAPVMRITLFSEHAWNAFMDFTVGSNLFITRTAISRDLYLDPITGITIVKYYYSEKHTACSLRAGAGLGTEFPLGKKKKTALVIKGSYLYGSYVTYYARPVIHDTQIILSPRQSAASMILAETGIRFGL
jgi:hypothetical protein